MKTLQAKKRFGQNFLDDHDVIEKIIHSIHPKPQEKFLEIGPGEAALTKPLLQCGITLEVLEIDRDLIAGLQKLQQNFPKLVVHAQDALTFDFSKTDQPWRVVGNLPYNISSPLLLHCFRYIDYIKDMHFMLQKELVDRLCAEPDTKDYGRLSVITHFFCDVQKLFDVPPHCFHPAPKVTSTVFRLVPKKERLNINVVSLEEVTRHAFGQRRKTLRNALHGILTSEQLIACGIDPIRRAETLSLEEFCKLAALLESI